jgi:DNA-binding transcriptional regulator LsrR (DeoR family)
MENGQSVDQLDALVQAARMYYEQDLSQSQIAERMGRSRPTVSRLLATARDQGIVRIEIRVPQERNESLERALVRRLGLVDCRVMAASGGAQSVDESLGRGAAAYLKALLQDGMTVGISSGRSLAATARFLEPNHSVHLEVVQIIGALTTDDATIDTPDIARALASAYDARCRYLHVPLMMDSVQARDMLVRDRNVAATLQLAAHADVVVVGIGTLNRDRGPLLEGLLSPKEVAAISAAGGVGHICGEHYDLAGKRLDIDINDRVVGIGLGALRRIPRGVAVAGGTMKAPAIIGAVRGRYFDTLITDERAANAILRVVDERWPRPAPRGRRPTDGHTPTAGPANP